MIMVNLKTLQIFEASAEVVTDSTQTVLHYELVSEPLYGGTVLFHLFYKLKKPVSSFIDKSVFLLILSTIRFLLRC